MISCCTEAILPVSNTVLDGKGFSDELYVLGKKNKIFQVRAFTIPLFLN